MDDFYQYMAPLEGATNNDNNRPSTQRDSLPATSASSDATAESTNAPVARASWSSWGASFNKLIERSKKDMNEFVDVTRKDLTELVHTVQQERTTALETLTKRVEDLKTTLPPLPASVNSASTDILGRMSHVVEGIKQEITEAATGVSSQAAASTSATSPSGSATADGSSEDNAVKRGDNKDENKDEAANDAEATLQEGNTANTKEPASASSPTTDSATAPVSTSTTPMSRAEKTASLSFANTASLLTASASTLTQTLSSSTKDLGTSANQLFKKTLPAVAEKHLGEADIFLKNTTETLKTNGLLAEQYVNKFGAGMANFLNSAVVISAPEEKEIVSRNRKMFFDRKAVILEKLRMDPATYTVDPMTTIADNDIVGLERYKYFLQTFNMAEYQQRISRLLNEYPEVKALMTKLVPAEVADEELFWMRYHFRLFEIEEEEKRRQKLVQEAGADLAEEDFTWDDNDDDDEEEGEPSGGQGSITPKAEKKNLGAVTPKANQILSGNGKDSFQVKQEPLTAEALASSLSALPIPDEATTGTSANEDAKARSGSEDEWGAESLKSSANSISIKSPTGAHSKSPTTNMSSTRTSEDAYEVVDGVATPVRVPLANVLSLSSEASSPALERSATPQSSKLKTTESKDEDDWSDWE
ncbi:BSD domain-containing protein 1 [Haplosporangium sp. Z 767]|nr:BSD domain-containing protein 1 [Haplosporangium sp. Z 767]KAF9183334.1 BSD domain-containing protein 1 [Haplosporangium sp. Z 11]